MTTHFHAAEALMDKYISLLENYEKDGATTPSIRILCDSDKSHRRLCTDIAVRILLTLGGGALYKGGINRIIYKRYFISSYT